jgi:hypothetical protein
MVRTWKIGATGSMLIGFAVLAACSSSDEDPKGSGGRGSGASGGTGGATGGAGGTTGGTGGATGGTGGSVGGAGGSMGGTAGATTGGTAGSAAGSAGSGGAAGGMGFTCKGTMATCNAITDFAVPPGEFGSGDFHGGASVFGAGVMRDMTTTELHVTGMVTDYGHGFNLWFAFCSDISAFTGVSFVVKGTAGMPTPTDMPNIVQFQLQTNSNYPWQPFAMETPPGIKGACTAPAGMDPWGVCLAPSINVTLGEAAQMVPWAMMMGGMPTAWDPVASPKEIVGIQFQFPWKTGAMPYAVDVILDDVKLIGAAAETVCPPFSASGGAGGMGGMGGMAGSAGAAGSGAGTAGGGGMAGAAGSGAGTAGAGGMAGTAGSGAGTAGAGGMAGAISAGAGGA